MNWLLQTFDSASIGVWVAQFQAEVQQPVFWVAVSKIIWIDLLLSGDNALVIALACRGLEPQQRRWGIFLGAGAAIIMRVIFTGIVAFLMGLPYLKLVGGLALVAIAVKLLLPDNKDEEGVKSAAHLWGAVQVIVVADIVMSLDNVIAVAAAAKGSVTLLVFGLALSIPLIIVGAALIMALLNRFPILLWAGAALLAWVAGEVIATDPAIHPKLQALFTGTVGAKLDTLGGLLGLMPLTTKAGEVMCATLSVIVVLVVGSIWRRRTLQKLEDPAHPA